MILIDPSEIKLLVSSSLSIYSRFQQWWPIPSYHQETDYFTSIFLDANGLTIQVGNYFEDGKARIIGYVDYIRP